MIDDATNRWFARFVSSGSMVENMNHLERYLKKHGRPLAYYTDKAAIFQTAEKTKRDGRPRNRAADPSHRRNPRSTDEAQAWLVGMGAMELLKFRELGDWLQLFSRWGQRDPNRS